MFVNRDRTQEYREEIEEILMDRIRELHRLKCEATYYDGSINKEICMLAKTFAIVSSSANDNSPNGDDETDYRCERANCRNRK